MRRIAIALLLIALTSTTGIAYPEDASAPPSPKSPPAPAEAPTPDVMAQALADAGLTVDDLGFRSKGTWARYPNVVPFKMPFFDDLLAHPLDTYEFTRTLGNTVEDLLTPEKLRAAPEKDKPESLFSLAVALATDRRIGGFRGFGINLLDQETDKDFPLEEAYHRLVLLADETGDGIPIELDRSKEMQERIAKFYGVADAAEPGKPRGLRPAPDMFKDVPAGLHLPLARLLVEMAESIRWIERGLRNVPAAVRDQVRASLPSLVGSTPDANRFFSAVEDAANSIDSLSLAYGSLKALAAVQRARREIEAARPKDGWGSFQISAPTPWGDIVVVGGQVCGLLAEDPPLLFVATEDYLRASGALATSARGRPLSVALFLRDVVELSASVFIYDAAPSPIAVLPASSLGAGVLGCGILYAAGQHDTRYFAGLSRWALGAGLLGIGVLVDEGGNDTYRVHDVGEGAAMFGAGLLLDAAGDDKYELLGGDGQGFGGPGGIGVLADRSGNDHYYAEPRPEKAGKDRADYHSGQNIVGSNAQGAGMGRRGDVSDGHAWAGGLGALLDVGGDDVYEAGNFSQGVGYWFGTGLLYDGGGNDVYRSVYFSHGSGAHFAVGAVVDEGGDDQHLLTDWPKVGLAPSQPGAGIAFGWDVVNAMIFERAGNDRYESSIISEGVSNIRSMAFLLDEGGDDVYVADAGAQAFGSVDDLPTYREPHRTAPFAFHLSQVAMLLDLGGKDQYLRRGSDGHLVPDTVCADDRSWGTSDRDAAPVFGRGRNVAIGRDVARAGSARLGFLDAWPRRTPTAKPKNNSAGTPSPSPGSANPPPSLPVPAPPTPVVPTPK